MNPAWRCLAVADALAVTERPPARRSLCGRALPLVAASWRLDADAVSMRRMAVTVVRYSDRPELWQQIAQLSDEAWPEYNVHGEVISRYWPLLYELFADHQFVLYDSERDEVLAEGQTIPCAWNGTPDGLGPGIDDTMSHAFALHDSGGRPDTLCALAAKIPLQHQDKRLAAVVLTGMADIARRSGLRSLIAPVRPNWKDRYPITPIERYVRWTRADGSAFDPWIRVHLRLGATLGPALPHSMRIAAGVAEWETWTGMRFPESGDYVLPQGLAPLHVDVEGDLGEYWEPNVWLIHPPPV